MEPQVFEDPNSTTKNWRVRECANNPIQTYVVCTKHLDKLRPHIRGPVGPPFEGLVRWEPASHIFYRSNPGTQTLYVDFHEWWATSTLQSSLRIPQKEKGHPDCWKAAHMGVSVNWGFLFGVPLKWMTVVRV